MNYQKVRDHCHHIGKYRGAAHNICKLKFKVPNEIPVVFHNDWKYDYHLIIKKLVNEFKCQFESIGENNEIYKSFSFPIKNEIRKFDKEGNEPYHAK